MNNNNYQHPKTSDDTRIEKIHAATTTIIIVMLVFLFVVLRP